MGKTKAEIEQKFNTKIKVYQDKNDDLILSVKHFPFDLSYIPDGWEERNPPIRAGKSTSGIIRESNYARTRQLLLDYASANSFYFLSFVTLTIDPKRYPNCTDIDSAQKYFNNYCTQLKRKKHDLKYLGAPELQKNGHWHFHLLMNLKPASNLLPRREKKRLFNPLNKTWTELIYYDLPYWIYGYSSAFDLSQTDTKFNVALYITKYMHKDKTNKLFSRKKVIKSNNLIKPDTERLKIESETYKKALAYAKEKDSIINQYSVKPVVKYGIPSENTTIKLSADQYIDFIQIINE